MAGSPEQTLAPHSLPTLPIQQSSKHEIGCWEKSQKNHSGGCAGRTNSATGVDSMPHSGLQQMPAMNMKDAAPLAKLQGQHCLVVHVGPCSREGLKWVWGCPGIRGTVV